MVTNSDVMTAYYGIHDALRELGDTEHDAGDGPGLDTPHVVAGLWDASSALSRLFEQLEAYEKALSRIAAIGDPVPNDTPYSPAAQMIAREALNPASRQDR